MRIQEILTEMSSAIRGAVRNKTYYLNTGGGEYGYVLKQTGESAFFPDDYSTKEFANPQETQAFIKKLEAELHTKIVWTNREFLPQAKALAVVKLVNEKNQPVFVGKLLPNTIKMYKSKPHDPTDEEPGMFDTSALEKLGYVFSAGNTLKNRNKEYLKPLADNAVATGDWSEYQSVLDGNGNGNNTTTPERFKPTALLNPANNLTISNIMEQLHNKIGSSMPSLYKITEDIAIGKLGPWPLPNDIGAGAFTTNYCEILQPMAIASGAFKLKGVDGLNSTITFNTSESEKLIDSLINTSNGTLLISTKKEGGTKSSVGGLKNYMGVLSKEEQEEYKKEIDLLNIIFNSGIQPKPGEVGVLQIGIDLGILSEKEALFISSNLDRISPSDYKVRYRKEQEIPAGVPDRIKQMINSVSPSEFGPSPYFQALTYVMRTASKIINEKYRMNDLMNILFAKNNLIFISTEVKGGKFNFVRRETRVNFSLGEAYNAFEAKKRISFHVK